ncbi:conserved hypothetical protein [Agrobacterium tumefaciens str. Kerr 14]|uniref:DUF982 domain-containing protein n=1 Tax=Agrobacterium tumefaciens str. Kerr 14 TaxID=1183424 RepID=A0A1S7SCT4_AGRTU|nr:DUF982 domain-containing protein [Agrobacterium tumefaciens]CUX66826.1 conserved hypothetical protein [Agrobacterium tumefaciens str. Kerr 14]
MENIFWDKPVVAGERLIFGPMEAQRFLHADWPYEKNLDYVAADLCILKALDGRATPDEAREMFETAVQSANPAHRPGALKLAG